MIETIYHLQASEATQSAFVPESQLRTEIHGLFCSCDSPATCDNEYLAEFDDSFPQQWKEYGGHWELEDGWVRFAPVKMLFSYDEIGEWCCELGAPEYVRTDDGEAMYWRFSGSELPVADTLPELFLAARSK
jgi:hypothetical protein